MPEAKAVQSLFSGIAARYDAANRLLSGGIDLYWRRRLVLAVAAQQPQSVLDLATGSGDVALALRKQLPPQATIAAMDFCEPMLEQARRKQAAHGISSSALTFSFGDCLNLPVEDTSVDAVTIAFGLRNLEDRDRGLREMRRVLRPGSGFLHVLEFTQPAAWFRPLYVPYLRWILPRLAQAATGDRSAYEYLVGSIDQFPPMQAISDEILAAGFRSVRAIGMTGRAVALHSARA